MRRTRKGLWSVVALVCALGLLGAGPAAAENRNVTDDAVTEAVEDEFLFDRHVPLNDIQVSTIEGVVTLDGTVDSLLAADRAVRIAETVRGVRAVVDELAVKPYWGRSDWQLERDAERALLEDAATDSWEIGVEVTADTAVLTGTVDSWQEKQLAEKVVKGVKGIKSIDNDVRVDYKTERTDYEIEKDVQKALAWDTLVDHALVDIEVADGDVRLTGTVGSAAEKRQARWDAWVAGVESVDASKLKVKYWARNPDLRKNKYVVKKDGAIEQAVEDAMLYDPRVNSLEVDTTVTDGLVILRGSVDSLMAKRAAENDARHTVGVVGVKNRLKVEASTPTPEELEQRVENALTRDPYVERFEIGVAVYDDEVYLSGVVDSYFEKQQADDLAASIYGVEEVHNNLDVEYDTALVYNPYVYVYDPFGYAWYDYEPVTTFETDLEIAEEIDDEMWWSPYVDADEVQVTVVDGVATLSGTVDSFLERANAVEEAYEGGAVWVKNEMKVD